MNTLQARNLTLQDVENFLKFQERDDGSFTALLSLEPLTEAEQQQLRQIRDDFRNYLKSKPSEGQVKLLAIAPLLRLAGFYRYPIKLKVEEDIAKIQVEEDGEIEISGRFDIIAVNTARLNVASKPFCILVIETKKGIASTLAGLPQLLTYTYEHLNRQEAVWGLVTNGADYQFVYIQHGERPSYQYLPSLTMFAWEDFQQLLQVLKAIRLRQADANAQMLSA